MEGAPLRPVPRRPAGPVDPAAASLHVGEQLPGLDDTAATALALVELAGRARADVAAERGVSAEELAAALARGRKALRRSIYPLPGSGWCERAERYISDRIDGELEPPGPARLEVHLKNCSRCVEHERRLDQARDGLVASFEERAAPAPVPAPAPAPAPPEPGREVEDPPAPELRVVEEDAPSPPEPPAEVPAAMPPQAVPAPLRRTAAQRASSLAWMGLFAMAVALAVASVLIAVLGVMGASI